MPGEAYRRFLDSMEIGFDEWHDGTGYDLEALGSLDPAERGVVEVRLIANLEQAGDWRDVDALAALDTASAWAAVDRARSHRKPRVRSQALRVILAARYPDDATEDEIAEWEEQVLQAVEQGDHGISDSMPTRRVKEALLEIARAGDRESRMRAASHLLYLVGLAWGPLDWSHRPFLFRLGDGDPETRRQAWEELRERTGLGS